MHPAHREKRPWAQRPGSASYNYSSGGAPPLPRTSDEQDVGKSAASALGERVIHTERIEDLE